LTDREGTLTWAATADLAQLDWQGMTYYSDGLDVEKSSLGFDNQTMRGAGSLESGVDEDWDDTEVLGLDDGPAMKNDGVGGIWGLVSGDAERALPVAKEEHSIESTSTTLVEEDNLEDFFEDKVDLGFDGYKAPDTI
jgi:hypothetical protein